MGSTIDRLDETRGGSAVLMSWSGGKDCTVALQTLVDDEAWRVEGLLTTVTRDDGRVGAHGVRRELVARQAQALELPLYEVALPAAPDNAVYEAAMAQAFAASRARGCRTVAYGDLFLEDLRAWRDALAARQGMTVLYPAWGRDTGGFAQRALASGVRATVCCVDLARLDARFVGRSWDAAFLADLPADVDPCGEAGEFHTFVHDAPLFHRPVPVTLGERTIRGAFAYCDLLPG